MLPILTGRLLMIRLLLRVENELVAYWSDGLHSDWTGCFLIRLVPSLPADCIGLLLFRLFMYLSEVWLAVWTGCILAEFFAYW